MWNLKLSGQNSINNLKAKLYKAKGIKYVKKKKLEKYFIEIRNKNIFVKNRSNKMK